jgi:hypothetical protein
VIVREFKDSEGRPWRLALTCASAARVRDTVRAFYFKTDAEGRPTDDLPEERPFDIVSIAAVAQTLQILRNSYIVLAEALYAILLPQCEEKQVTREQFLEGLSGDSLDAGRVALEEELVAFFPGRLRGVVSSLARKMDELVSAKARTTEEVIAQEIVIPGPSSTSAPASSESIPESGPSENYSMPAAAA